MKANAVKGRWDIYIDQDDYEEHCYLCSPSISNRMIVKGKPYYIRRFFTGDINFETAIQNLAIKQANKQVR